MCKIDSFSGDYRFLSNFYPCIVELDWEIYPSVEHAYQAAKTLNIEDRKTIQNSTSAKIAKKLGKYVSIREDWEDVKLEIMANLVWQKFSKDFDLKDKLLSTHGYELIEGNRWNDTYWGVCNGFGQNNLGKLLMAIRHELENT